MACVAKYHRPLNVLDESPRKRRKLTSSWDVLPSELQSQPTIISADPENGNGKVSVPISSGAEHSIPSDHSRSASSALKPKEGISRNGYPPWRNDDKERLLEADTMKVTMVDSPTRALEMLGLSQEPSF